VVAEYASRTSVMKDGGILMDAGTRRCFPGLIFLGGRDVPVLLTVGELERYV